MCQYQKLPGDTANNDSQFYFDAIGMVSCDEEVMVGYVKLNDRH